MNAKSTEQLEPVNTSKNAALSQEKPLLNPRSFDVDAAFKKATQLIRSGVLRPSKYGLQRWTQQEFSCLPSDRDIVDWQAKWLKQGLIEPAKAGNGKKTFKLKVNTAKK